MDLSPRFKQLLLLACLRFLPGMAWNRLLNRLPKASGRPRKCREGSQIKDLPQNKIPEMVRSLFHLI